MGSTNGDIYGWVFFERVPPYQPAYFIFFWILLYDPNNCLITKFDLIVISFLILFILFSVNKLSFS